MKLSFVEALSSDPTLFCNCLRHAQPGSLMHLAPNVVWTCVPARASKTGKYHCRPKPTNKGTVMSMGTHQTEQNSELERHVVKHENYLCKLHGNCMTVLLPWTLPSVTVLGVIGGLPAPQAPVLVAQVPRSNTRLVLVGKVSDYKELVAIAVIICVFFSKVFGVLACGRLSRQFGDQQAGQAKVLQRILGARLAFLPSVVAACQ